MKKFIAVLISAMLIATVFTFAANAEGNKVKVRIEGIEDTFYYGDYSVAEGDTVYSVLKAIDEAEDNLTLSFLNEEENPYLNAVNGEVSAKFSGWDGWQYVVNDESPDVGMSDITLNGGESIVVYYGDYPCANPVMDVTKSEDGELKFWSGNTTWLQDGSGEYYPSYSEDPVVGAEVILGDQTFTTDEEGKVYFNPADYTGFVNVQISRYAESGAPTVCRFAPDFGFELLGNTASVDEASVDEKTTDGEQDSTEPTTSAPTNAEPETTQPATTPETSDTTATAPVTEESTDAPTQATETTEPVETTVPDVTVPETVAPTERVEPTTEAVEPTQPAEVKPTEAPKSNKTANTTITVKAKKTLYVKGTYKINPTVKNGKGNTTFTSSNSKVAKVDKKGVVTAVKKGTARITVKNNNVTKTVKITVKNPKLNKKKVTLKLKGKKTFKIKITGKVGKAKFKTSKKSVAKVNKKGIVTAVSKGKAKITVKSNGVKLKLKVTVK